MHLEIGKILIGYGPKRVLVKEDLVGNLLVWLGQMEQSRELAPW